MKINNWSYPTGSGKDDEGWYVNRTSGLICRNPGDKDTPGLNWPVPFGSDEEAREFVKHRAEEDSELHKEAIRIHTLSLLLGSAGE